MTRFNLKIYRYPLNVPHISAGDYVVVATKPPFEELSDASQGEFGDVPSGSVWVAGDFPQREIALAALETAKIFENEGLSLEEIRDEIAAAGLPRAQQQLFEAVERAGFTPDISTSVTDEEIIRFVRTTRPEEFEEMQPPSEPFRN